MWSSTAAAVSASPGTPTRRRRRASLPWWSKREGNKNRRPAGVPRGPPVFVLTQAPSLAVRRGEVQLDLAVPDSPEARPGDQGEGDVNLALHRRRRQRLLGRERHH